MARAGIQIKSPAGNILIDDRYHNVALVSSPTTQSPIYAYRQGDGVQYIFDEPTNQGSGPGILILNSVDHRVAFDSRLKYARVVEVPSGTFSAQSTDGAVTLFNKIYPVGHTYAYAALVRGHSEYFKSAGAGITHAVSCNLTIALSSARALTVVATTVTESEPLSHTPTTANQARWMIAVLDVTGY